MCLIFYSENGNLPAKSALRVAYENNPDGVGIMYHDGKKVQVIRGLLDFDATWGILSLLRAHQYKFACHFRYRTKGPISSKTCHPFRIREYRKIGKGKNDGFNTFMMHNGTFMHITVPKGQSDTQAMAGYLETLVNKHGSHLLTDQSNLRQMGKKVGDYNKMVFMNDNGEVNIVNAKSGFVKGGIWYSNNYSFTVDYRKKTTFSKSFSKLYEIAEVENDSSSKDDGFDDFEEEEAIKYAERRNGVRELPPHLRSWLNESKDKGYIHKREKDKDGKVVLTPLKSDAVPTDSDKDMISALEHINAANDVKH